MFVSFRVLNVLFRNFFERSLDDDSELTVSI